MSKSVRVFFVSLLIFSVFLYVLQKRPLIQKRSLSKTIIINIKEKKCRILSIIH